MKIRTVPVQQPANAAPTTAQIVMLELSGPLDPTDTVLQRARELVRGTGSEEMMKSFDWAVSSGALVTEK